MPERAFIDQLAEVWSRILAVGRELAPQDWKTPTECPGWSVQDQLAHMTGTESLLLGQSPPAAAPEGRDYIHNPIGQMNEAWVDERRARSGAEVLAEFETVTAQRLAKLKAMTDVELDEPGPSPIGTVPYHVFMNVRVMDCWVHEQDIRRAVERPGGLGGPAAEAAIDRLAGAFPFAVGKRVAPPEGTSVVLDITGPVTRTLAVELQAGRAVKVAPPAQRSVGIRTDTETFACLVAGRWTGDDAVGRGRVTFTGDAELGRQVVGQLTTIP